jgi:hypothetical protein
MRGTVKITIACAAAVLLGALALSQRLSVEPGVFGPALGVAAAVVLYRKLGRLGR